ncbi:MAG: hypothetical protein LBN31_05080 [Hungatella sp.]|jgi:hypothetical protein|uniref:hypothetical protein n=1 Tax=Clostridium sp. NkU-1 TaxID=1095009 RepID=UPI0006D1561F|nr:hypothetical protein [Hungatella sp.]MDR1771956.1 hypothetical protein [Hungatella sp.]MDR2022422.1 hypothetical protein [Hungatella sp.]
MKIQGKELNELKEEVLRSVEGKTDEEKREMLRERFNIDWDIPRRCGDSRGPCKFWYAQVFTYCSTRELEEELNFFLFLINFFGHLFGFCFSEESTVFLGCTCPCGSKQIILYYSIVFKD